MSFSTETFIHLYQWPIITIKISMSLTVNDFEIFIMINNKFKNESIIQYKNGCCNIN